MIRIDEEIKAEIINRILPGEERYCFMKNYKRYIVVLFCFVLIPILATAGESSEEIEERMKSRLSAIERLKNKGIVGEANSGYLKYLSTSQKKIKVVEAENADRKKIYTFIAKKVGATVDLVGKRRAKKITEIADPGHWLQDSSGRWYKK